MDFHKKKRYVTQSKRSAVRIAHNELLKLFQEFNITHVNEVSGAALIRICCRTFDQLQDISSATKIILQKNLITKIGMPTKHNYKFKTLVLYLKPIDVASSIEIYNLLLQRSCDYLVTLVNSLQNHTKEKSSTIKITKDTSDHNSFVKPATAAEDFLVPTKEDGGGAWINLTSDDDCFKEDAIDADEVPRQEGGVNGTSSNPNTKVLSVLVRLNHTLNMLIIILCGFTVQYFV